MAIPIPYAFYQTDGNGQGFSLLPLGSETAQQFIQLVDVPSSYSGQANKLVRVKSTQDQLEFVTPLFTSLNDVPASFVGQGLKMVRVNTGATALEFSTPITTFSQLTDVPASYSGQGNKYVTVNSGGTALQFTDLPSSIMADVTLGADVPTYTLSAPSQAYNHLRLVSKVRTTAVNPQFVLAQLNSDSTEANYGGQWEVISSGNVITGVTTGAGLVVASASGTSSDSINDFAVSEAIIPFYTGGAYKRSRMSGSHYGSGVVEGGGRWKNISAITAITLFSESGSLKAGSRFILYGVL